jgi:putative sigma-54 modulation protein
MGRRGGAETLSAPFTVELHAPDFAFPTDLAGYIRARLATKLAKFGHRLLGVMVRVKDVNGPKGGDGIVCGMEALLAHMEPVNVEERGHDLRAALDLSLDRFELALQRHVERARTLPRTRGRKLVRNRKLTGPV